MVTKAQKILDKASSDKRSTTSLIFPADAKTDGTGNIIRFHINLPSGSKYLGNEYKVAKTKDGKTITSNYRAANNRAGLAKVFSGNYTRTSTTIDLFMPDSITSAYSADWSGVELGALGSIIGASAGLVNFLKSPSWDDTQEIWEEVKTIVPEIAIRTGASMLSSLTPFNFDGARQVATSTLANPYKEVVFSGVGNRTFNFKFKLIARNKKEQELIKKIVYEFKFHQAPEIKFASATNYWDFPSEFDIQFIHRDSENPWLFKISTCALTAVDADYTSEGIYASHSDGSPFSISLSLTFQELETLTKERISEGY